MKSKLEWITFTAALLTVVLLADAWRSARKDSQQLAATMASQNKLIQQTAEQEKQHNAQLTTALAAIQAQKRAIRNPQQAAAQLAAVLPPLPLPVVVHIPNLADPLTPHVASPSSAQSSPSVPLLREETLSLPTPNAAEPPSTESPSTSISIPQPDLIPLYDALQDCRADKLQTATLQEDLTIEKAHSAALQRERDAAVTQAHGGTFIQRLQRAAKWFAIGLAAGALTTVAARHYLRQSRNLP